VFIEEEDPRAKLLGLIKSSGFWSSDKAAQVAELAEEEEEWFGMLKGGGRGWLIPPRSLLGEEVLCLVERKGDGDDGVEGADGVFEDSPKSFRALRITEWTRASGPNANLIISFSPWSWMSRRPMILDAFSGSKFWILEKTILVAS
jgi:hypothetical protein